MVNKKQQGKMAKRANTTTRAHVSAIGISISFRPTMRPSISHKTPRAQTPPQKRVTLPLMEIREFEK